MLFTTLLILQYFSLSKQQNYRCNSSVLEKEKNGDKIKYSCYTNDSAKIQEEYNNTITLYNYDKKTLFLVFFTLFILMSVVLFITLKFKNDVRYKENIENKTIITRCFKVSFWLFIITMFMALYVWLLHFPSSLNFIFTIFTNTLFENVFFICFIAYPHIVLMLFIFKYNSLLYELVLPNFESNEYTLESTAPYDSSESAMQNDSYRLDFLNPNSFSTYISML